MKRLISVVVFEILAFVAWGQVPLLTGVVMDAETGQPLPYANVFINRTTIGTTTDLEGKYSVQLPDQPTWEIVFSYVGYQTIIVNRKPGDSDPLFVRLKPDKMLLDGVSVTSTRDKKWAELLKKMTPVFLGSGKIARDARIMNPWVLEITEVDDQITATASAPIEIENPDLGYSIRYILQKFVMTSSTYQIKGSVFFKPMITDDPATAALWLKNRYETYKSSPRYLFKSIISNNLTELKFYTGTGTSPGLIRERSFAEALKVKLKPFNPATLVSPGKVPGSFRVRLPLNTEVHHLQIFAPVPAYSDLSHAISWMEVSKPLDVTSSGIVMNQGDLSVMGYLSEQRVAEQLPIDYDPGEKPVLYKPAISNSTDSLQEKVVLVTDKPYYYAGEKIWFSAFMQYNNPERMDSLSKVLHVELIDENQQVLAAGKYPIENGLVSGRLVLAANISTGNHFLRAYTSWMRNFDLKEITLYQIPVLDPFESPVSLPDRNQTAVSPLKVRVEMNKIKYQTRELVEVSARVLKPDGTPLPAKLSVSVIDKSQVVRPLPFIKPDAIAFKSNGMKSNPVWFVEKGLTFGGRVVPIPKSEQVTVSLFTKDLKEGFAAPVDIAGNFTVQNLHFIDTITLAAQVHQGPRNKISGKIVWDLVTPKLSQQIIPYKTELVRHSSIQYQGVMDSTNFTLLEAVEIKDTRIPISRDFKLFGTPDVIVNGQLLQQENYSNLMYALQARVSGMILVSGMDENGVVRTYVRFGGLNSFGGNRAAEPLLLIDGVQIPTPNGLIDALNQISTNVVERIEVIKYGSGAAYGSRGGNGIIAVFTTRPGDAKPKSKILDPAFFNFITLKGFETPEAFPLPDASAKKGVPDFRATICWIPIFDSGDTIRFYTSDKPGEYEIVLRGFSGSTPVNAVVEFVVE